MRGIVFLFFLLSAALLCSGCSNCPEDDFIGKSRSQISGMLEKGPKLKDGSFRVLYRLPDSPPATLVHHFHKNKVSLLNSQDAMSAPQWQCFFHNDGGIFGVWHSYLLTFEGGRVVRQEDRKQPHWTMAEP